MEIIADKEKHAKAVLGTLNYFHIFKHPLTLEEIHRFLSVNMQPIELYKVLCDMVDSEIIYYKDGFYLLQNNLEIVQRRADGNKRAEKVMEKALRSASLVGKFPFVRAVCISGSLSKGYANEKSDIDLFIITKKNRLWISRSLLHFFKKLTFIWGDQHSYCMNYFIDESRLCLEEQNIFTATELTTLLPVYNTSIYRELINANKFWLIKLYPNNNWNENYSLSKVEHTSLLKTIAESVINVFFAKQLNIALMKFTDSWWRYKWNKKAYPMEDYDLAMKTKWYVSKNHPHNYQKKVLAQVDAIQYNNVSAVTP